MHIYDARIKGELTLKDTNYSKCACEICAEKEFVDDYDILSSALHPNIKAGFMRYRDWKETKEPVGDIKLFPTEIESVISGLSVTQYKLDILSTIMVHCKTLLFSGNVDFMKNVLTSSLDCNSYNPFGMPHYKDVFKDSQRSVIKGYNKLDETSLQCCYCDKILDTSSDDFICLRIMDKESRHTKNSCCVNLQKHDYSIVSYVWTDIDEVCDHIGDVYYGIDGKPLDNMMQKLLNHVVSPTCKYVWIDQICIDQENVSDKELSVTHMDKTYSYCDTCIVCLRKSTVKSLCFSEALQLDTHSNFNGDIDNRIMAFLDYSIVLSFINDPWFSRGWTLQESILPRQLCVAVGRGKFIGLDRPFRHSYVWIGRMSLDTNYITELFSVPNSNNYICSVAMSLASQLDAISDGRNKPMNWSIIAKIMSSRQTTVELDQIFCLRGILPRSKDINVDYSADMELVMKQLCDLYPESHSSLYYNIWACERPSIWSQYRCLPPLLPIENPTTERECIGECVFIDISNSHVEGSIIRGCIETAHKCNLDINYVLGDATFGILEILYPEYIDETIIKADDNSGRAAHMFLQLELYSRTWMAGTMIIANNRALLAFLIRDLSYNTPKTLWIGNKRCFESAKYVVPLFMDDEYIGWCFYPF